MLFAAIAAAALIAAATASQVYATQQAADYNRESAKNEAEAAQERAAQQADAQRRAGRRRQAQIQARFAGQGVVIESGSAFDVMVDQAIQDELSALQVEDEAEVLAWQRDTERKATRFTSRQRQVTTILSGGAQASSTLMSTRNTNAPKETKET